MPCTVLIWGPDSRNFNQGLYVQCENPSISGIDPTKNQCVRIPMWINSSNFTQRLDNDLTNLSSIGEHLNHTTPLEKPWWRHASYSPEGCWCRKISLKSIAEFRESRGQQNLGLTWEDWDRLKTIDFEIVLVIWLFLHQLSCSTCCVQVTTSSAHPCSKSQPFLPWKFCWIFESQVAYSKAPSLWLWVSLQLKNHISISKQFLNKCKVKQQQQWYYTDKQ